MMGPVERHWREHGLALPGGLHVVILRPTAGGLAWSLHHTCSDRLADTHGWHWALVWMWGEASLARWGAQVAASALVGAGGRVIAGPWVRRPPAPVADLEQRIAEVHPHTGADLTPAQLASLPEADRIARLQWWFAERHLQAEMRDARALLPSVRPRRPPKPQGTASETVSGGWYGSAVDWRAIQAQRRLARLRAEDVAAGRVRTSWPEDD